MYVLCIGHRSTPLKSKFHPWSRLLYPQFTIFLTKSTCEKVRTVVIVRIHFRAKSGNRKASCGVLKLIQVGNQPNYDNVRSSSRNISLGMYVFPVSLSQCLYAIFSLWQQSPGKYIHYNAWSYYLYEDIYICRMHCRLKSDSTQKE